MDSKLKEILKEEKRRRREAEGRREGKDGRDKKKRDSEESPEGRRKGTRDHKEKEKEGNRSERRDKEKDERAARHEREKKERREKEEKEQRERERKEREEYRMRKEKEREEREAKAKEKREEEKGKEEMEEQKEEQKEDPHANLGIDENTFMFVFEDKKGELYNNINKITKDDKDEIKIFPVYFKGCDENLTEETVVYDLIANKIVPLPENSETSWLNTLNDPKNKVIPVPIGDIIVYNGKLFHCLYDLYDYLEFYGAEVLPLK